MKFRLYTLVDITNTNARRGDDKMLVDQQANYLTFLNIIGLRINPEDIVITSEHKELTGFGSNYKGKQKVWIMEFNNPYEDALTLDMLKEDFDLIPIITGLSETVSHKIPAIFSKHKSNKNIYFTLLDK